MCKQRPMHSNATSVGTNSACLGRPHFVPRRVRSNHSAKNDDSAKTTIICYIRYMLGVSTQMVVLP